MKLKREVKGTLRALASSLALLTLAIVVICPSLLGADRFSLDGYYKNFSVVYSFPGQDYLPFGFSQPVGSVSGRLRVNTAFWFNERVHLRASYDFAPRIQDPLLFTVTPSLAPIDALSYRVADFDARLYPSEGDDVRSFGIFHNLDRLYLSIEAEAVDLYIGRQPVAFGSARVVNPTDVIAPYNYEALDTEDRIGVDAVRARVPMGFMGEVDAGYVFGDDFESEQSACFLRTKFYTARTDISLMAMTFRENEMVGIDVARSFGGAGFWLEAAHVFADGSDGAGRDYFRASIGMDYSFINNTYVFGEYHFNQAGKDDPDDYLSNVGRVAYTEGSVYLMGRHYFTPGVTWEFTPLIVGSMQILTNLSDGSFYLTPGVEYNVANNMYLSGGAFLAIGEGPQSLLDINSEFGIYPDIYHMSFRYYF